MFQETGSREIRRWHEENQDTEGKRGNQKGDEKQKGDSTETGRGPQGPQAEETEENRSQHACGVTMKTLVNGKMLKAAIRRAGLDIESFAARLGVHERTIYFYLEGRRVPTVSRLMDMSQILKVAAERLVKNSGRI